MRQGVDRCAVLSVAVELARFDVTGFPWGLLGTARWMTFSLAAWRPGPECRSSFGIMLVNVAVAADRGREKSEDAGLAALAAAAVLQEGRSVDAPAISGRSCGAAGAGKYSGGRNLDPRRFERRCGK